jgi:superfamily II DNA or RNA helicase
MWILFTSCTARIGFEVKKIEAGRHKGSCTRTRTRTRTMISLRPHQQAAYDVAAATDRGIIKMFCGTGKTRIFLRLALDGAEPLTLIVFPRIALVAQFKRDYFENAEWADALADLSCIYICSEDESTTDRGTIEEFLLADAPKKVACITYQSLPLLAELLEDLEMDIDLAIYDEAHHCEAEQTYGILTGGLSMGRSYYFTATPTDVMEADEDEVFGSILFSYTHREAVEDDICNEFEIVCRFALPGECNLYEHMGAAHRRTPNGRILAFHSFAEAEVEGRTSVTQFSGAKAQRECAAAFKPSVPTLQAVVAKTKGKQAIIDAFEATADDQISILHNCSILGEGIDTKAANAIVFADPKASTTQIIQNIGRATRRPAGVQRPASIIIPVVVDIEKFNAATTTEERHSLICDEFKKGNFQAIQNVLGALRQEDEELMDAILRSPTKYTRAEVERTFRAAGYKATAEAATVGELCGLGPEATEEEAAAAIGQPIEVHSGDMEEPVRTVGSGSAPLKVMHVDDTWTKMEGNGDVKAPRRPLKVRYDISDKLGIKWDAECAIKEIGAATIDCTLGVDNWEERRQEFIAFMERSEGKHKPDMKSTDAIEKSLAMWMRNQIQNKRHGRITPDRLAILSDDTPYWSWDIIDKWAEQYEYWCSMRNKYGRPLKQGAVEVDERKAAKWQSMQRLDYTRKQKNHLSASWLTDERIKVLSETDGWTWGGFDEIWDRGFDNWHLVCSELGRCVNSKDLSESQKLAHRWQHRQRKVWQDGMSEYRRSKLDGSPYWCPNEKDAAWNDMFALLIATTNALNRRPTNSDNKPLAKWCARQREKYKKGELSQTRISELRKVPHWEFDLKSASVDSSSVSSTENTLVPELSFRIRYQPTADPVAAPATIKLRKFVQPPAEQAVEPEPLRVRRPHPLEVLHQRYKSMNSATYAEHMAKNPAAFHEYHAIADERDAIDPPERKVMTRLAQFCAKLPSKCRVADLGCGKNILRSLATHCTLTPIDAVAVDPSVIVADLAALPFDDCHFQAAVLSRALWARDHKAQLSEAYRVLNYGAPLIVCEAWGRWTGSELLDDLKSAGFHIKVEPDATSDEPFQYIVAQKPALL